MIGDLIERVHELPPSFDGYCTDCENGTRLLDGRCGCGSGRVVTRASLRRALQHKDRPDAG